MFMHSTTNMSQAPLLPPIPANIANQTKYLLPLIHSHFQATFFGENSKYTTQPLLATDTGSRSFGFPSYRSDFDIHFIFIQSNILDYFTIRDGGAPREASMELHFEIHDDKFSGKMIEVNATGWDLIYFLRMLQKNNPAVVNCINSPNTAFQHEEFGSELHDLWRRSIATTMSKLGYFQSILSIVRNNIQKYFTKKDEKIRVKVYLYALQYLLHSQAFFDMYADMTGTLEEANERNKQQRLHASRASRGIVDDDNSDRQQDGQQQEEQPSSISTTSLENSPPLANEPSTLQSSSQKRLQPALNELLPPLHPQELVQTTSLVIPPRFIRYFMRLVSLKRQVEGDPLVERNFKLEVWICMIFKRLHDNRGRLPRVYANPDEIDALLRETVRKYYHLPVSALGSAAALLGES